MRLTVGKWRKQVQGCRGAGGREGGREAKAGQGVQVGGYGAWRNAGGQGGCEQRRSQGYQGGQGIRASRAPGAREGGRQTDKSRVRLAGGRGHLASGPVLPDVGAPLTVTASTPSLCATGRVSFRHASRAAIHTIEFDALPACSTCSGTRQDDVFVVLAVIAGGEGRRTLREA